MKNIKKFMNFYIFVICILHLNVWSNGQDESVGAPMKRTEQEALYSAIQGFVGKWWNGLDLYPDPCGWTPIQGVSCDLFDGFWYVTDLSIGPVHENSLNCAQNVEFSPSLFSLSHLKSLSFFNCFVSLQQHSVSIPTQNWEFLAKSLESLEFRSNPGLTGTIPLSFGELINLKSLVLVENGLTGEIPVSLGNLTFLKRMTLAENSLNGQIPNNFGGLRNLLILDISRNSLSGIFPSTFKDLSSLLKLDLSNNKLEGQIPQTIENLKNLTLLDLSNNRFSNGLTKSLQELTSLEELVLSNNPIGGDLMSLDWVNLMRLALLDLSNTSLTGVIPESIADLKGLRFLGLNDNKLTGDISSKIERLPNLSAMYIHGNNLTGVLKFSEWFYGKMRSRFGAWSNPNLCYHVSTSYAPFGVKQCEEEKVRKYETHFDSKPMSSLGFLACGDSSLVFLVDVLMVLSFIFYL